MLFLPERFLNERCALRSMDTSQAMRPYILCPLFDKGKGGKKIT